jgi:hypothetical protein
MYTCIYVRSLLSDFGHFHKLFHLFTITLLLPYRLQEVSLYIVDSMPCTLYCRTSDAPTPPQKNPTRYAAGEDPENFSSSDDDSLLNDADVLQLERELEEEVGYSRVRKYSHTYIDCFQVGG